LQQAGLVNYQNALQQQQQQAVVPLHQAKPPFHCSPVAAAADGGGADDGGGLGCYCIQQEEVVAVPAVQEQYVLLQLLWL
jgi:hypothetical protein